MPRAKSFERIRVVDACLRVFKDHGFKATSIQELVQGAETNRKTIYDVFIDKEGLYKECVALHFNRDTQTTTKILSTSPLGRSNVRNFWDWKCQQIAEEGCFATLIINERNSTPDEAVELAIKSWSDYKQLISKNLEVEMGAMLAENFAETFVSMLPSLGTRARQEGGAGPGFIAASDMILERALPEIATV